MRTKVFDRALQDGGKRSAVITNDTGMLEDLWGHRWNWKLPLADTFAKLIVHSDRLACGVQQPYWFLRRNKPQWPSTHEGHLHQKYARYQTADFPVGTRLFARENKRLTAKINPSLVTGNQHLWNCELPIQFRALVLAGETLFAAGWRDTVRLSDEQQGIPDKPMLLVIDATSGKTLAEHSLPARPVFDGMAAAHGKLYLALQGGTILCLGDETSN